MKRFRKFTALLMAMVMVLAMGVTSFAAEKTQPTLTIGGEEVSYTMPSTNLYPDIPDNAENKGEITAADIFLEYAVENYGQSVADQMASGLLACDYDQNYVNEEGEAGLYISKYLGQDTVNNYTFISYDEITGLYTYQWTGAYWSLTIDGEYASSYATAYKASDIDSIDFTHVEDNVGYTFTTPYEIPDAN